MEAAIGLALIALGVVIYFIPGIVAHVRGHHQENAIVLLNLFLGWTFIGWVAALVWAATAVRSSASDGQIRTRPSTPLFPKLIAGLLLLGVVVIGGGYLAYTAKHQDMVKDDAAIAPEKPIEQNAENLDTAVAYLPVDAMVVDLADENESRVAQISVTLAMRSRGDVARVTAVMPSLRAQMITLVSQQRYAALLTREGKEQLASQILNAANSLVREPAVTAVLYSGFVLQ